MSSTGTALRVPPPASPISTSSIDSPAISTATCTCTLTSDPSAYRASGTLDAASDTPPCATRTSSASIRYPGRSGIAKFTICSPDTPAAGTSRTANIGSIGSGSGPVGPCVPPQAATTIMHTSA